MPLKVRRPTAFDIKAIVLAVLMLAASTFQLLSMIR